MVEPNKSTKRSKSKSRSRTPTRTSDRTRGISPPNNGLNDSNNGGSSNNIHNDNDNDDLEDEEKDSSNEKEDLNDKDKDKCNAGDNASKSNNSSSSTGSFTTATQSPTINVEDASDSSSNAHKNFFPTAHFKNNDEYFKEILNIFLTKQQADDFLNECKFDTFIYIDPYDIEEIINENRWSTLKKRHITNLYFFLLTENIKHLDDYIIKMVKSKVKGNNEYQRKYTKATLPTPTSSPTKQNPTKSEQVSDSLLEILRNLTNNQISTSNNTNKPYYHQFELKENSGELNTSDIDGKSFMNNVKLPIDNKRYFLTWYGQFQIQCDAYNVKIRSIDDIKNLSRTSKIISECDWYKSQVSTKIGQLLLNKLSDPQVITEDFKEGRDQLKSVKNGFEFLNIFLRELHPHFSSTSIVSENIPKFSDFDNIYEYSRAVKDYFFRLSTDGIIYNDTHISESFLTRLDSEKFFDAKTEALRTFKQLKLADASYKKVPPPEYSILNLPGTILNLQKELQLPARSSTNRHMPRNPYSSNSRNSTHNSTINVTTTNEPLSTLTNDNTNPPIINLSSSIQPFCTNVDEPNDDIDPFVNYTNRNNNNNARNNNRNAFKGRCRACGVEGHHAKDCWFLQKLQKCLSFLQFKPQLPQQNKRKYERKGIYDQRKAIVRSLVDDGFIPYNNVDCDIFIDDVENRNEFDQYE